MWVNGEKYVFSQHVLSKGTEVFKKFKEVTELLPVVTSLSQLNNLMSLIISFDVLWCLYEQAYVGELMVIERDAKRFIYDL